MIQQVRFSEAIKFFEKDFRKRWPLTKVYDDFIAPCLFMGCYRNEDLSVINAHKGFKLVWLTGADMKQISKIKNAVFVAGGWEEYNWFKEKRRDAQVKFAPIELKDFSQFKPIVLGDKVYYYVRDGVSGKNFKYELLNMVRQRIGFEVLLGYTNFDFEKYKKGRGIVELKRDFYDKAFINLRLNEFAGGLSMQEMAHMGRRTISNRSEPYCLHYKDADDIARIIEEESKKIGTMPTTQIPENWYVGDEWQDVNFWRM